MKTINLLFADSLKKGSTVTEYFRAFEKQNVKVHKIIEKSDNNDLWSNKYTFWNKVCHKLGFIPDKDRINERLLNFKYEQYSIDAIFVGVPQIIRPKTLEFIKKKNIYLISFTNDNLFLSHYNSIYFKKSLRLYDLFIMMNIEAYIQDYLKVGINIERLLPINKSFSMHYAIDIYSKVNYKNSRYQHDLLFIGSFEKERYQYILHLANNLDKKIHIYGPYYGSTGWKKIEGTNKNIIIHNQLLLREDYVEAIKNSKICLAFLREVNADTQTSRTFEIPAYGGVMVMQETKQQKEFFKDQEEVIFFNDKHDLLKKVRYYLENDIEREKLRINARKVSLESDYSFDKKVVKIKSKILKDLNHY